MNSSERARTVSVDEKVRGHRGLRRRHDPTAHQPPGHPGRHPTSGELEEGKPPADTDTRE